GLAIVVCGLSVFEQIATGMHTEFFYGYAPRLAWGFAPYSIAVYLPIVLAFRVLFRRLRRLENPEERIRVWLVILGTTMSVVGGTTDYIPPLLDVHIYPLGVVMNIGFGITTTIAVTRYRLFEL